MNINNELEKFRQEKAQDFFTKELPNRLKGFEAALEGTPEEIERKLEDQKEIYILNFWDKLDELTEQEKKTLELAGKTADILCKGEERSLASEIIADQSAEIEKLKAELQDKQENLDICAGLADRYMYRQRIVECTLKLKDEKLLKCAYTYMKKLTEGEERWNVVH